MRSLYDIRFAESIRSLVDFSRINNIPIDGRRIEQLERELYGSLDTEPSTDNLRLYPFETLDFKRFLAYLYAIEADSNFIASSLDEIANAIKNLHLLTQVEKYSLDQTKDVATKFYGLLLGSTFIDGVTREIQIPEDFISATSSIKASKGKLTMNVEAALPSNRSGYVTDDVEVIVTRQDSMITNTVEGDRSSILDNSFRRGILVSVFTRRVDTVSIRIRIKAKFPSTNKLTLDFKPLTTGTSIRVSVLPKIGDELKEVFSDVINSEEVIIDMPSTTVEHLVIDMTKSFPDVKDSSNLTYLFSLEKVRAENTVTARDGEILSKAISLPAGTDAISVVTQDYIPDGSTIKYELAPVPDEETLPTEWFALIPSNKNPKVNLENNELPSDSFISTQLSKASFSISKPLKWDNPVIPGFRTRMFNILDGFSNTDDPYVKIVAGEIQLESGVELVGDSIKVYNGIDDWEVVQDIPLEIEDETRLIAAPEFGNTVSNWYDHIDIVETITEQIQLTTSSNVVILQYEPRYDDNIRIIDSNGLSIAFVVNDITGTSLTVSETFNKGEQYTISYTTKIRETSSVVTNTLVVTLGNAILQDGIDYIYSPSNNKIALVRSSTVIPGNSAVVLVSYTKEYQPEGVSKFFRTWFELGKTTTITIQPFTQFEYVRGNFHRINGVDVSQNESYTLGPGLHYIESTQPEPSATNPAVVDPLAENADVNIITREKSSAGIVTTNLNNRAFRNPLRKVSIADLEFNVEREDRKVYAIHENKILMNKRPSYLDNSIFVNPLQNGRLGAYIRNKKLNADTGFYESLPEKYQVVFVIKTPNTNSFVRCRITMQRGGDLAPRVERLGITPIDLS